MLDKEKIWLECQKIVAQKIDRARTDMENLQESANEETKSSAGDKYETGRAMMQLEKDKHAAQLAEALKLKKVLDEINISKNREKVDLGALVATDNGTYFLSVGLGKVNVDGHNIFVISMASPIGQQLKDKQKGESFVFNNSKVKINELC